MFSIRIIGVGIIVSIFSGCGSIPKDPEKLYSYDVKHSEPRNIASALGVPYGQLDDYNIKVLNRERGAPTLKMGDIFDGALFLIPPAGSPWVGASLLAAGGVPKTGESRQTIKVMGWVKRDDRNPTISLAVHNYHKNVSEIAISTLKDMGFTPTQQKELEVATNKNMYSGFDFLAAQIWSLTHDNPDYGCTGEWACMLFLTTGSSGQQADDEPAAWFNHQPSWFKGSLQNQPVWTMNAAPSSIAPVQITLVSHVAKGNTIRPASVFNTYPFYQKVSTKLGTDSVIYAPNHLIALGDGEWSKEPLMFHAGNELRFIDPDPFWKNY